MIPLRRLAPVALLAAVAACADLSGPSEPAPIFTSVTPSTADLPILQGQSVNFVVEAVSPAGDPVSYEYHVNEALVANSATFVFTPAEAGEYDVEVIATTGRRSTTRTWTVTVTKPPNAAPSVTVTVSAVEGEAPFTVTVQARGSDPDGAVVLTVLDFNGDGTPDRSFAGSELEASFTYETEGSYAFRATVTDDKGATGAYSTSIVVRKANSLPTGNLIPSEIEGDAPLAVVLSASGGDPDGQIVKWEIDADDGNGFVEIPASGSRDIVYPFRESEYRPRLRLTDDRNAVTVVEAPEVPIIAVFRPISEDRSSVTVEGNPFFDVLPGFKPAIWADGEDRFRFTVRIHNAEGNPLVDVPVRVTSLRPHLTAPDGSDLGETLAIVLDRSRTDATGSVSGVVSTRTSGRVPVEPTFGPLVSFSLKVEANAGHGEWRRLDDIAGLNAETIVSTAQQVGNVDVVPSNACAGQERNVRIRARTRQESSTAGAPVAGVFVDVRYLNGKLVEGLRAAPGYEDWRTGQDGWITLRVTAITVGGWAILAWVDGVPLNVPAALGVIAC